jgi:hypothetical protein
VTFLQLIDSLLSDLGFNVTDVASLLLSLLSLLSQLSLLLSLITLLPLLGLLLTSLPFVVVAAFVRESTRIADAAYEKATRAWQDKEQEAMSDARVLDERLDTRELVQRHSQVLQHVYRLSGGVTDQDIHLRVVAADLGLSLGQAFTALSASKDSGWVRINRNHGRWSPDTTASSDRVADWSDQTVCLTLEGKDRVEHMHEPSGAHITGDGNVVVTGSDGNRIDRINIQVNKKLAQQPDLKAVAEGLALLRGEIEALPIDELHKRRGQREIGYAEAELADPRPDPDSVRSALTRVNEIMVDAGETYDAAAGWGLRLREAVRVIAGVLGVTGWL